MKKVSIATILLATMISMMTSCHRETNSEPIAPLYKYMAEWSQLDSNIRDSILRTDSLELNTMMEYLGYGAADDTMMLMWQKMPAVEIFSAPTDSVYPTLTKLENELGKILTNAKKETLQLPKRRYSAIIWGNLRSMLITDSCLIIALNHYLGADYPGYSRWPAYQRLEKTPERLPYDIAEALVANKYPFEGGTGATVASRMVYEGALALAKIRLTGGNAAEALGYSEEQYEWLEANREEVWNRLVGKNLLYSGSEETMSRLFDPAPATNIIAPFVTGRAGRYLGYKLVEEYAERHSDIALPQLFYLEPETVLSGR